MRKLMAGLLLFSSSALAGEMYGTITEAGKPIGEGVAVEARCGEKSYPAVKTDKSGAYHLAVQEKGKCHLTVRYKSQSPALDVASYDEGVQVDLVLESKDGSYTLRRK
ncbi:MAG TPA: hypothetical protein VGR67_09170 [Candidatus Polarisedimenticolia bacterium]|jgi:hypothetical protein|nr:hypothetical protein [Candidatus Polarisedimenticolia bacterium]